MKIINSFILILFFLVLGGCSSVGNTPEPNWRSVQKEGGQPPFQSPEFKLQFGR